MRLGEHRLSNESLSMNKREDDREENPRESEGDNTEALESHKVVKSGPQQIARFVTRIKNIETQIGEHIVGALQHPQTVAVLTTIAVGPDGSQHIVSAALNPIHAAQVNQILQNANQEREEEIPCVGFHCFVKPKNSTS